MVANKEKQLQAMKNNEIKQSQAVDTQVQPHEGVANSVADEAPSSATTFDAVLERMKEVTGVKSDTAFAKSLGLNQSSVSGAKERQSIPPTWAIQIAEKYGVSLDWLMFGEGSKKRKKNEEIARETVEKLQGWTPPATSEAKPPQGASAYNGKDTLTCFDCELMMVPLVEAKLSAGSGSFETSSDSDRRYAFRMDFLRRKGNASAMVLMRVAGDSMEPKIEHNDVVLIDTSKTELRLGCMYAVAVQDLVYLKMVNAEPGKLILTSANQAYAPLEIDARGDLKNGIRIIGKAVWVGRELD